MCQIGQIVPDCSLEVFVHSFVNINFVSWVKYGQF